MNCLTFNYRGFTPKAMAEHYHHYRRDKKRISAKPLLKYVALHFFWFSFGCQSGKYIRNRFFTALHRKVQVHSCKKYTPMTELHIQCKERKWRTETHRQRVEQVQIDYSMPYSVPKYISIKRKKLTREMCCRKILLLTIFFSFPGCSRISRWCCCKNRVGWETEIPAYN